MYNPVSGDGTYLIGSSKRFNFFFYQPSHRSGKRTTRKRTLLTPTTTTTPCLLTPLLGHSPCFMGLSPPRTADVGGEQRKG